MQAFKFIYNGGTNPGRERIVIGERPDDNHIRGFCLNAEDYRTFLDSLTKLVCAVDALSVDCSDLPKMANGAIEQFEEMGYDTRQVGDVVYAWQFPETPVVRLSLGDKVIVLDDKNGNNHLFSQTGSKVNHYIDRQLQDSYEPAEFVNVLTSLV